METLSLATAFQSVFFSSSSSSMNGKKTRGLSRLLHCRIFSWKFTKGIVCSHIPLEEKCHVEAIVYKATITTDDGKIRTYTGSTDQTFKKRHYGHTSDIEITPVWQHMVEPER